MVQHRPSKSGLVQLLQSPVERYTSTRLNFLPGTDNHGRCEQVKRANFIFLPVLVEKAPSGAVAEIVEWLASYVVIYGYLRHPGHCGHIFPFWEFGGVHFSDLRHLFLSAERLFGKNIIGKSCERAFFTLALFSALDLGPDSGYAFPSFLTEVPT